MMLRDFTRNDTFSLWKRFGKEPCDRFFQVVGEINVFLVLRIQFGVSAIVTDYMASTREGFVDSMCLKRRIGKAWNVQYTPGTS